jgi:hypothetical protein
MLTQDILKQMLHYDSNTGVFTWICDSGKNKIAGKIAGTKTYQGYVQIKIKGSIYRAHRLAWLYTTGQNPADQIDHIDGNKANNAISNLRDVNGVTNKQNMRSPRKDNKAGALGVAKKRNKYRAQIKVDEKIIHLGVFSTIAEASSAYINAKRRLHEGSTI